MNKTFRKIERLGPDLSRSYHLGLCLIFIGDGDSLRIGLHPDRSGFLQPADPVMAGLGRYYS